MKTFVRTIETKNLLSIEEFCRTDVNTDYLGSFVRKDSHLYLGHVVKKDGRYFLVKTNHLNSEDKLIQQFCFCEIEDFHLTELIEDMQIITWLVIWASDIPVCTIYGFKENETKDAQKMVAEYANDIDILHDGKPVSKKDFVKN